MIEKNIFVCKLFLSLNIPDFILFFVKTATSSPEKSHPLFPSNLPLKIEILSSHPFLKIWSEVQPSSQQKGVGGGGGFTLCNHYHKAILDVIPFTPTSVVN